MRIQRGFTLIELVVVIVILGILAATALPKFVDLKGDAQKAATEGVAAAISSGSTIYYSKYSISATPTYQITNCTEAAATVSPTIDTAKFTVGTVAACAGTTPNKTGTCSVTYVGSSPSVSTNAEILCTN